MAQGWLMVYMDDMMIATRPEPNESEQQHKLRHCDKVKQVLQILQDHNLFLQPEKCEFEKTSTEFLGIRVEKGTIHMDNKKVKKSRTGVRPRPSNKSMNSWDSLGTTDNSSRIIRCSHDLYWI